MSEQLGNCSLGGYDDDAHVKACSAGAKCARCTWVKYKACMAERISMVGRQNEYGEWQLGLGLPTVP